MDVKLDTKQVLGPIGLEVRNELETYYLELKNEFNWHKNIAVKLIFDNQMDFSSLIEMTHVAITTSVAIGCTYTGLADKAGKDICNYYHIKVKDTGRVRLGAFIIDAFVRKGLVLPKLIKTKTNNRGQKTVWMLYARDRSKLEKLRNEFPRVDNASYTLHQEAAAWTSGFARDEKGNDIQLVRGVNFDTARKINQTETPLLLRAINKKQAVAYSICENTYETFKWSFESKAKVFDFFHNQFMNADARKSKLGQNEMLLSLAGDVLKGKDNTFFQRYFCDFRGRIYPEAKYLNEIGTDSAKGLLRLKHGKALGDKGLNYLYHHIANCYGFDKESHEAKIEFVTKRFDEFVNYGLAPKAYQGWMETDAPFQFLNGCFELAKLDKWLRDGNSVNDFVSNTICYFDGSNNGAQWLFALAKDSKHSHLVNVIKSPDGKFGDFYKYVGNRVFNKLKDNVITEEQRYNFNKYLQHMFKRRKQWRDLADKIYHAKTGKANLKQQEEVVLTKLSKFQTKYKDKLKSTNILYWQNAINEGIMTPKEFRTIVKRPCMTFAYSGTVRGFAQQILDDSDQFENEYIQNKQFSACFLLAEMIYSTIEEDFPELVAIRNYLTKVAGAYVDKHKKNLEFRTVISSFPFTNGYFKPETSRVLMKFYSINESGNLEYKEHELHFESDTLVVDKRKGKLGISPNFVHQLDALHLQLVVEQCSFDIVTAHDSYGSLPSDAELMNKTIRECMVRVLEADPIGSLSKATGDLVELPKTGDLDINEILKSEFAFA